MASGPVIRLAVFGNPVAHSISPRIHGLFAGQAGLRVDYQAVEATAETFEQQVAELAGRGGKGCNITVPFKAAAWRLAQSSSAAASRARAANTLVFRTEQDWFADSTDGMGLVNDLRQGDAPGLNGARICLLGAGGAAASVLGALLAGRPRRIVIANRTLHKAEQLATTHRDLGEVAASRPEDLPQEGQFDIVINATSSGHAGLAPVYRPGWLSRAGLCYDMNYGTASEPLARLCAEAGNPYRDGLGMLVEQAALSFESWTGFRPGTAAVREQLRQTTG